MKLTWKFRNYSTTQRKLWWKHGTGSSCKCHTTIIWDAFKSNWSSLSTPWFLFAPGFYEIRSRKEDLKMQNEGKNRDKVKTQSQKQKYFSDVDGWRKRRGNADWKILQGHWKKECEDVTAWLRNVWYQWGMLAGVWLVHQQWWFSMTWYSSLIAGPIAWLCSVWYQRKYAGVWYIPAQ